MLRSICVQVHVHVHPWINTSRAYMYHRYIILSITGACDTCSTSFYLSPVHRYRIRFYYVVDLLHNTHTYVPVHPSIYLRPSVHFCLSSFGHGGKSFIKRSRNRSFIRRSRNRSFVRRSRSGDHEAVRHQQQDDLAGRAEESMED